MKLSLRKVLINLLHSEIITSAHLFHSSGFLFVVSTTQAKNYSLKFIQLIAKGIQLIAEIHGTKIIAFLIKSCQVF